MGKPLVVVVDIDENYLATLEYKLLELSDDDVVEYEFISEPLYLQQFFSKPRTVDIVVIDESLYLDELKKHNIDRLYILTKENEVKDINEENNITYLFKYKSSKEIINEIISSIRSVFVNEDSAKTTKVITFYGASGGSGKSSIGLGVAGCLANSYQRVLYINTESIQSFGFFLKKGEELLLTDYHTLHENKTELYTKIKGKLKKEGFVYLPPMPVVLDSLNLKFDFYIQLVKEAKKSGEYDTIIVDLEAGYGQEKLKMIDNSDKVILVTKQDAFSKKKLQYLVRNIDFHDKSKYLILCNMYDEEKENAFLMKNKEDVSIDDYIEYENKAINKIDDLVTIEGIQKLAYIFV